MRLTWANSFSVRILEHLSQIVLRLRITKVGFDFSSLKKITYCTDVYLDARFEHFGKEILSVCRRINRVKSSFDKSSKSLLDVFSKEDDSVCLLIKVSINYFSHDCQHYCQEAY